MKFARCIAHAAISLALCVLVLLIFEQFNPTMYFLTNSVSMILEAALCVSALIAGILILTRK